MKINGCFIAKQTIFFCKFFLKLSDNPMPFIYQLLWRSTYITPDLGLTWGNIEWVRQKDGRGFQNSLVHVASIRSAIATH